MNSLKILVSSFTIVALCILQSCQSANGNQTGSEYMPDMAHSVAYEANTFAYYYPNRWGTEAELHNMTQPRKPVMGTIARGYAGGLYGATDHGGIAYRMNGSVPYYYADTEEDRTRAINEIISNPYPITDSGLLQGKALYNVQCAICHGEKGDGAGYLVRDNGGKYPVQPANFLLDDFILSSNGRYYHTIMVGRNLMGAYNDKLTYQERWNVIHYIRSLQAESKKLVYNEKENTLNNIEVPYLKYKASLAVISPVVDTTTLYTDTMKLNEVHNADAKH